jgi:PAS domain S-box-containing protein
MDVVVVLDNRLVVTYVNRAVTAALGWEPANVIGRPALDFVHPADREVVEGLLMTAVAQPGFSARLEFLGRHRGGRWVVMEGLGRSVGRPSGGPEIVFTLRDISERRRTEGLLRLLRAALDVVANGILITDAAGRILWTNPAFTRMTGYDLQEVRGATPRVLKSGAQASVFYRVMWRTIVAGDVWRGEVVNRRKDGELYHEEQTITPLRNAAGEITHFIAIKQDVSARRRHEDEIRRQRDALVRAERLADLGRLAAGIEHELRNPLTVIIARLQLLQRRVSEAEASELGSVLEAADRIKEVLRAMSSYAEPPRPAPTVLDLRDLLRDTAALVGYHAKAGSVRVSVDPPEGPVHVVADRSQLMQILVNLGMNGIRAMEGRNDGGLTLRVRPAGAHAVLEVRDTGVGIAPDKLTAIWEPFYTTKPEGTGLGLSIVKGLVAGHPGSTIDVESALGEGTVFRVVMPLATSSSPTPPEAAREAGLGS